MRAAARRPRRAGRMLVLDPRTGAVSDGLPAELARWLGPEDRVVVNDAATLPASLPARTPAGAALEVRLVTPAEDTARTPQGVWWVVLFGAGDWRLDTDLRPAPPALALGDPLCIGHGPGALVAHVAAISERSPRLVALKVAVPEAQWAAAVYRWGRPVQYRYHAEALPLSAVQTAYAGRPWAVEMPSAGRPLTMGALAALRAKGVRVVTLTHAGAG